MQRSRYPLKPGMSLPFAACLCPSGRWGTGRRTQRLVQGRSESISADNAITAQIDEDPASGTAWYGWPDLFSVLGRSSLGLGSSSCMLFLLTSRVQLDLLAGYRIYLFCWDSEGRRLQTYGPLFRGESDFPREAASLPFPRAPIVPSPAARPAGAVTRGTTWIGVRGVGHR